MRYTRQLPIIGIKGQEILRNSKVLIVGAGALGNTISNLLVRAGVNVTILDRDVIELNNLQRQTLFDENDLGKPKAKVLEEKLRKINSEVEIEGKVVDLNPNNAEKLIVGHDLVIDATDNLETRFLINDVCLKNKIPWIYGAVIKTQGYVMSIKDGPCLRCFIRRIPKILPTCETAGILNTLPSLIGSIQVTEAIKILLGEKPMEDVLYVDLWKNTFKKIKVNIWKDCPAHNGKYEFLERKEKIYWGCNWVKILGKELDLKELYKNLKSLNAEYDEYLIHLYYENLEISIYRDGVFLVKGTKDINKAKSLYSKLVGV